MYKRKSIENPIETIEAKRINEITVTDKIEYIDNTK